MATATSLSAPITSFPHTINSEQWREAPSLKLPSYPPELTEFLRGRENTHTVVPLFPMIEIDGSSAPLSFDTLDEIDKAAGGSGCELTHGLIRHHCRPRDFEDTFRYDKFQWAVFTNEVIPGTQNATYNEQKRTLGLRPEKYEAPPALATAVAMLWAKKMGGKLYTHFSSTPTYTHCREVTHPLSGFGLLQIMVNVSKQGVLRIGTSMDLAPTKELGMLGFRSFSA